MSNYNYEKYKELIGLVGFINIELNKIDENDYKSKEVEQMACQLISIGNKINAYIRHSKIQI